MRHTMRCFWWGRAPTCSTSGGGHGSLPLAASYAGGKESYTMNPYAPRTYGSLQRVTERVYIFRNIVNSAVILGDEAIAVIDTQVNEALARRLLQHIRTLSDKPIRYA